MGDEEKKGKKLAAENKKGKSDGEKKGKKFALLSEDDGDMEDLKKAVEAFENASPDDKKAMLDEGRKSLKEEGLSDEEVEKAVKLMEKGDADALMEMKKEMDKKHGKKGKKMD